MARLRTVAICALAGGAVIAPPADGYSTRDRRAAAQYAKSKLGMWYSFGAIGPSTFDCSGLTYAAYRHRIPRTSYAQLAAGSRSRHWKVGDLLFRGSGHVGIFIGHNQAIHASKTGFPVARISASFFNMRRVARRG